MDINIYSNLNKYFIIFSLFKNNTSIQIINYLKNYDNKEELNRFLILQDNFGYTPFSILFYNKFIDYDVIYYLINNFDLINFSNYYSLCPINYALLELDDKKIIKLLLDNCKLDILDSNDNNLYHYLIMKNNEINNNFIKYLYYNYNLDLYDKKNKKNYTPLLKACLINNTEAIKFFINIGCDYNTINDNNNTCLMYACMHNNFEIIKLLLEKNVDINKQDNQYDVALSYSCGCDIRSNCDFNIIKYLIDNGANYNNIDIDNNTILMYICGICTQYLEFNINIEILKYLLKLDINRNIKNKNNKTFYDILIEKDKNIFIKLLNEKYIKIDDSMIKYYYFYDFDINLFTNIQTSKIKIDDTCLICRMEFEENNELLKCSKHYFHKECLIDWFKSCDNLKCPYCYKDFEFRKERYII